jgi:diaminohydroxyphosphoribosylaminopyrimidine deaminase/5-amino-6-(5-phosphoribosylamino)uracil reductase
MNARARDVAVSVPSHQSAGAQPWMTRALELAARGEALASPNPMVGAVLVRNGKIVGESFHTYDGLRHAEIIALEAAAGAARGATLYINLEPCCHQGRTPPCTRALIAAGVARVVAAMADPNPRVAGRGFAQLRAAGIKVELDKSSEEAARRLNEAFAVWVTEHRPLVTLKTALTLDGYVVLPPARNGKQQRWITSPTSRAEVQRMRHASDALLTGIGTVIADNPLLTDRTGLPRRRRLLRVVVDSHLRLSPCSRLVRSAREDLLVFVGVRLTGKSAATARASALRRAGVEIVSISPRGVHASRRRKRPNARASLWPDLREVLRELGRRDILSIILESGPTLNQAALDLGVVDKLRLFYAPKLAHGVGAHVSSPPPSVGGLKFSPPHEMSRLSVESFGPDFAVEAYLRDVYR